MAYQRLEIMSYGQVEVWLVIIFPKIFSFLAYFFEMVNTVAKLWIKYMTNVITLFEISV